jgi:hypothetical protein
MEKSFELNPPMMPNYITIKRPGDKLIQPGDDDNGMKISVTELTQEEAEEYGELMRKTFIQHWLKMTDKKSRR